MPTQDGRWRRRGRRPWSARTSRCPPSPGGTFARCASSPSARATRGRREAPHSMHFLHPTMHERREQERGMDQQECHEMSKQSSFFSARRPLCGRRGKCMNQASKQASAPLSNERAHRHRRHRRPLPSASPCPPPRRKSAGYQPPTGAESRTGERRADKKLQSATVSCLSRERRGKQALTD